MTLICFLDDSGTDPQNEFVCLAGYVGTRTSWEQFELDAAEVYRDFGIASVHAKELYGTRGEFAGWTVDRKLDLIRRLNAALAPQVGLAISFATHKNAYNTDRGDHPQVQSAFGFCLTGLLDRLLKDEGFREATSGPAVTLDFRIEEGNANQGDVRDRYARLKEKSAGELRFLGEMIFVSKTSSKAIQMADLFAFLTRRQAVAMERNGRQPVEHDPFLTALRANVRDIGYAATGFRF